jgi:glycosyltransferase involved in cell wall biosynthesis
MLAVMPRILYIQYTNPAGYPPLEHSSRILADSGWNVAFLSTAASETARLRLPIHARIHSFHIGYCPPGWRQKLHYLFYAAWVIARVFLWRPDWVYASGALSAPIALILCYWPHLRILYHEHDHPGQPRSVFLRLCLAARRKLASRVVVSLLPGEKRARQFAAETAAMSPVMSVWNCPARADVTDVAGSERKSNNLWLWYHGSIVPSQFPPTVIQALAKTGPEVRLRFAGYETAGHTGYVRELLAYAERLGIQDRVEYLGTFKSREELLHHCASCDVGLALFSRTTLQPMAGASNKPFDYMACGLALLVSDLEGLHNLFVATGYGRTCDPEDPCSIAASLRWYVDHPRDRWAMGDCGRQRILNDWNYETQFAPVLQILSRAHATAQARK